MLFRLFIGADNITKRLDKKTIMATALKYYPNGFTYYPAAGIWRGGSEKSAIVEILTETKNQTKVIKLAKELKKTLKQQAILLQAVKTAASFI